MIEAQEDGGPLNLDKFKAVFLLSGMEFTDVFPIQNGYCSQPCCFRKPWFLFRTEFGLIKIGWRKRVINIDWNDTNYRGRISEDDVTCGDSFIHAWSYGNAVIYLDSLLNELLKHARDMAREIGGVSNEASKNRDDPS